MIAIILLALAGIVCVFIICVASQPSDFRITRSAIIFAPASKVFAQVNNLHNWPAWSPWVKFDPHVQNTFEGPIEGKGAIYSWAGNNKIGEGRMTIIDSQPNGVIQIKLEFIKPFAATNTAEFFFKSEGNQTEITWSMFGQKKFMSKAMVLLMNCDKMIGSQFEEGLANMKTVIESA